MFWALTLPQHVNLLQLVAALPQLFNDYLSQGQVVLNTSATANVTGYLSLLPNTPYNSNQAEL